MNQTELGFQFFKVDAKVSDKKKPDDKVTHWEEHRDLKQEPGGLGRGQCRGED